MAIGYGYYQGARTFTEEWTAVTIDSTREWATVTMAVTLERARVTIGTAAVTWIRLMNPLYA